MKEIAHEVAIVPLRIANAYLVGAAKLWFLVDSGLRGEEAAIKKAVEARFGSQAKPSAIILTHGHPDHVGSAQALAEEWNVKVFAHRLELPYLSGQSQYPPLDPTSPGFLAGISRFFPSVPTNLGDRLMPIDEADVFPGISGWEAIPTPGHSPGHLSFLRKEDGLLLAGDAFTTMDQESPVGFFLKTRKLCRPATFSTIDWPQAKESVAKLARLHPGLLAAGHGKPMLNKNGELQKLADNFSIPFHGRYVHTAVQTGEKGVVSLPPAPPDYVPGIAKSVLVAGLAIGIGAVYPMIKKRLEKSQAGQIAAIK